MPSVSGKQHRFMGWSHSHPGAPGAAPLNVSSEFLHADKGKHFEKGGLVMHDMRHVARGTHAQNCTAAKCHG